MKGMRADAGLRRDGRSVTEVMLWLAAALFLGGMILIWWEGGSRDTGRPPPASATTSRSVQGQAPEFELSLLGGGQVSLQGLRGRIVLVHFWATWCAPCIEEAPELAQLARDFEGRPLSLVAVNVDEDLEPVKRFFRGQSPPYLVALDPGGTLARRYGTLKYPETYLLDGRGRVLERYIGPQRWSDTRLRQRLETLVAALTT